MHERAYARTRAREATPHVRAVVVAVPLCAAPCCIMWCEARMWFQCVCRTGEDGDKGAIVPHSSLKPSFLLTSQLP